MCAVDFIADGDDVCDDDDIVKRVLFIALIDTTGHATNMYGRRELLISIAIETLIDRSQMDETARNRTRGKQLTFDAMVCCCCCWPILALDPGLYVVHGRCYRTYLVVQRQRCYKVEQSPIDASYSFIDHGSGQKVSYSKFSHQRN